MNKLIIGFAVMILVNVANAQVLYYSPGYFNGDISGAYDTQDAVYLLDNGLEMEIVGIPVNPNGLMEFNRKKQFKMKLQDVSGGYFKVIEVESLCPQFQEIQGQLLKVVRSGDRIEVSLGDEVLSLVVAKAEEASFFQIVQTQYPAIVCEM